MHAEPKCLLITVSFDFLFFALKEILSFFCCILRMFVLFSLQFRIDLYKLMQCGRKVPLILDRLWVGKTYRVLIENTRLQAAFSLIS